MDVDLDGDADADADAEGGCGGGYEVIPRGPCSGCVCRCMTGLGTPASLQSPRSHRRACFVTECGRIWNVR